MKDGFLQLVEVLPTVASNFGIHKLAPFSIQLIQGLKSVPYNGIHLKKKSCPVMAMPKTRFVFGSILQWQK
jgi:hypothetical protein